MQLRRTLLVLALAAPMLSATTFERVSTAELARRSPRICAVQCVGCKPERDPESGLVFTRVRLKLLEDIKGRSPQRYFELRLIGGELDGKRTVVAGMPVFRTGGESVLLLGKPNRAGFATLVAARRGKLELTRDKKGKRYLKRRIDGFPELTGKRRVALDELRTSIRKQKVRAK
ncbi:MAG: hypothetical protein AAGD14_08905 [Planctomycetota bacterium]